MKYFCCLGCCRARILFFPVVPPMFLLESFGVPFVSCGRPPAVRCRPSHNKACHKKLSLTFSGQHLILQERLYRSLRETHLFSNSKPSLGQYPGFLLEFLISRLANG